MGIELRSWSLDKCAAKDTKHIYAATIAGIQVSKQYFFKTQGVEVFSNCEWNKKSTERSMSFADHSYRIELQISRVEKMRRWHCLRLLTPYGAEQSKITLHVDKRPLPSTGIFRANLPACIWTSVLGGAMRNQTVDVTAVQVADLSVMLRNTTYRIFLAKWRPNPNLYA